MGSKKKLYSAGPNINWETICQCLVKPMTHPSVVYSSKKLLPKVASSFVSTALFKIAKKKN